jgi:hypothetical protein
MVLPGRQPVINHDGDAAAERWGRPPAKIELPPPLDFRDFAGAEFVELSGAGAGQPYQFLVAHNDRRAAVNHRPDSQFRLARRADLANQQQVEGRPQLRRNLGRDRHPAAR